MRVCPLPAACREPRRPRARRPVFVNTAAHVQGKYLSLGVLRTRRDWQNSLAVLSVTAVALAVYFVYTSISTKRADALRRAAERELGVATKLADQ